jgi:hypothetical protein
MLWHGSYPLTATLATIGFEASSWTITAGTPPKWANARR